MVSGVRDWDGSYLPVGGDFPDRLTSQVLLVTQ